MATRARRGTEEYAALARALDHTTPPCTGDPRFILEPHELARQEVDYLSRTVCRPCPLLALCAAYGRAARPPAGIWGGRTYKPAKGKKEGNDD